MFWPPFKFFKIYFLNYNQLQKLNKLKKKQHKQKLLENKFNLLAVSQPLHVPRVTDKNIGQLSHPIHNEPALLEPLHLAQASCLELVKARVHTVNVHLDKVLVRLGPDSYRYRGCGHE